MAKAMFYIRKLNHAFFASNTAAQSAFCVQQGCMRQATARAGLYVWRNSIIDFL
jgi:hypothetical protein